MNNPYSLYRLPTFMVRYSVPPPLYQARGEGSFQLLARIFYRPQTAVSRGLSRQCIGYADKDSSGASVQVDACTVQ